MKDKNLLLIQALRGIAAVLVVLFHASANSKEIFGMNFIFNSFHFGGAGVDIFFVLSGFIITYISSRSLGKASNTGPFLKRRFIRIFPTYWIIISLLLLIQLSYPSFYRTHYSFDSKNLISTFLLLPDHTMVNGVSWTLSYELFFYLLFCLAFIIPGKRLSFILAMLYSLAIIILPLTGYNYKDQNPWVNLVTFPMNVEFFMGIITALLIPHIPKSVSKICMVAGIIMFLAAGVFTDLNYVLLDNNFNRVILFGIPSFLIITGAVKFELTSKIKVSKILIWLGEASYSLYLIHLPLLVASFKILALYNVKNTMLLHVSILFIVCIICCASILFYKFVEKPIITRLHSLRKIKVANEV